ncbi:MAG: hypothetical protein E7011_01790 [Alphaproteobacteria bacterium]|nr:hypothetical protein [Alphaproteobacteria bacterium]
MKTLCAIFFSLCCIGMAHADVYSVLASVYNNNPVLGQKRADVAAAMAEVDVAKTVLKPYLGLSGNVGVAKTELADRSFEYVPMQYGLEVQQNVFQGGAMFAKIKAAQGLLAAQQANMYATQQEVFLDAINAYINVLNADAVLKLNQNNERVLAEYYQFVKDGQDVGRMTKTDVAQASARLEMARYQVSDASAQYDNAKESVKNISGDDRWMYVDIDTNKTDGMFPESVFDAQELALAQHPVLVALAEQEAAVKQNIKIAYQTMLPSVDIRGTVQRLDNVPFVDDITDSRVGVYLRVPLFDKGNAMANADKVRANVASVQEQILTARRGIVENLRSAWNIYVAQETAINATRASVDANKMALDGIRDEQMQGRRTVLDVLNAEQELLNSQVAHTRAKHARISAYFAVLAAMGKLTPENLGLN